MHNSNAGPATPIYIVIQGNVRESLTFATYEELKLTMLAKKKAIDYYGCRR